MLNVKEEFYLIPITDITILVATVYNKNELNIFCHISGKMGSIPTVSCQWRS